MCHESMEINFNPKINFVVGRNGSGKSAILLAVVLGLGGQASATNRASDLKEFVKKGERTATIEITLHNAGPRGFKKDIYGDQITVVHTISSVTGGSSSYEIKSAAGNTVSTKLEDLLRITAALNIQVDNPVSVLNQDTARTFLNSCDPGDKYALFIRATHLDEFERLISQAMTSKIESKNSLNVKNEALRRSQAALDKLHERWETLKSVPEQKRKIKELENELLWACAIEKEQLQAEATAKEALLEVELRKLQAEKENEAKLRNLILQNQVQLAALRVENADRDQHFKFAKEKFQRCMEVHNARVRDYRVATSKVERNATNANTLRAEIDGLKQETGQDAACREEARLQLEQLTKHLASAQATLNTCTHHYDQLCIAEEPIRAQLSEAQAQADVTARHHKITRIKGNLQASMDRFRSDLKACVRDCQFSGSRVAQQQAAIDAATRATAKCAQLVKQHVTNAAAVCARINTRRLPTAITTEKALMEAKLAETERSKGSYLEVTKQYQESKAKHDRAAKKVAALERIVKIVTDKLMNHTIIYRGIRNDVTTCCMLFFKHRLKQRNYKGNLIIDHRARQLHITVSPGHRAASQDAQLDTRSLSGGERSYSTVLFIMALWESVAMPFYFMDVFDVFMDKVNRRIIMDMLLGFAKENPFKQFVFLTRQDISSIESDGAVTIHRMEDPRV